MAMRQILPKRHGSYEYPGPGSDTQNYLNGEPDIGCQKDSLIIFREFHVLSIKRTYKHTELSEWPLPGGISSIIIIDTYSSVYRFLQRKRGGGGA